MATYTPRYGLSKPEATDEMQSFMSDYAGNMDKIDENLGGGGGSANIVELTQAEYDALPDTKLTDDTMYLIKDANSASDAEFTHVYGFYIDETNKLFEGTMTNFTQTLEYTATEDAIALVDYSGSNGTNQWFLINNVIIPFQVLSSGRDSFTVPIRKGDKISARHTSDNEGCYFHLVVYGVKTGSEITIIPDYASACYSTQEREVGCWIDGKPLYQKTIDIAPLPYNVTKEVAIGADVEKVISVKGYAYNPNSNYAIFFNDVVPADHSGDVRVYANTSTDKVYITTVSNLSIYTEAYVTILYTKTTDVAGSGNWTPLGKPTVHYSTDEQVIGTWIDGKPVYEKTQVGGITFNGSTWQDTNIINVKDVISVEGVVLRDGEPIALGDFNNYLNTSWICRNNTIKVCVQSNTQGDPVQFKSITVRYTKTTD